MIDTLGLGWLGQPVGAAELRAFRAVCRGNIAVNGVLGEAEEEGLCTGWSGVIPGLGRLKLNADGFVRHESSLVKTNQRLRGLDDETITNVQLLSAEECDRTFQALAETVETVLPFIVPETLRCTRVDVCYQRPVCSSYQVLTALKGAIRNTRLGCAWFDNRQGVPTGLQLRGNAVSHRAYDKGLEALDKNYINVLRSEEQLRSKAVAMATVVNVEARRFDVEGCRQVLNERYLDVAFAGQLDVLQLVSEGCDTQALLILHPELLPAYKARVKKAAFYKMQRKVKESRASAIPADLRVPETAWR